MSTTIAFDTHTYVKRLRDAGVDEHQAEIQSEAILALVEDRLATKQDMYTLQRGLADVEASLKRDLADIRKDMATIEANLKRDLADIRKDVATIEADIRKDIATIEANLKRDLAGVEASLKRDIKELDGKIEIVKSDLKRDIETTKLELRKDIESAKVDAIKWTAGMFVAQTALIIGAMFAVMKMNQPSPQPTGYRSPPVQEMRLPALPTPAQLPVPKSP